MTWTHGVSGYSNHKCRCNICRIAWNAYCQERKRQAKHTFNPTEHEHGKDATYNHYGCRCDLCKEAHYNARHRLLTQSELAEWKAKQDNKCAVCNREVRLYIDHDHETQKIRGLLCHRCNTGIGKLGDSSAGLMAALAYLNKSR